MGRHETHVMWTCVVADECNELTGQQSAEKGNTIWTLESVGVDRPSLYPRRAMRSGHHMLSMKVPGADCWCT